MLTGMDVFGTDVVALRHKGPLGGHVETLAEVLGKQGYNTVCVGFSGNPASRGFQKYIDFTGWGSWEEGRSHKAENLNAATFPALRELAASDKPFFLFMRHMDPHSPYLPPFPFERLFYSGNEFDPNNRSLDPVYAFKPFCDYFASWFPPNCTDAKYICAQYDGAIAYMDACLGVFFTEMEKLGLTNNTLSVFDSDHGETLDEHDCYFDHHSIYDPTLRVPLAFVMPGRVPAGFRHDTYCQLKDVMPTILDLMGIDSGIKFDGRSLDPLFRGKERVEEAEFYITECTWMRKHGWRTPQWKFFDALEPDFHFKPKTELYDLRVDPLELNNLAEKDPAMVKVLRARMMAHIAKREKETGRTNPIYTNLGWHGHGDKPFKTSKEAYNTLYIGSPAAAQKLQANLKELQAQRGAAKL